MKKASIIILALFVSLALAGCQCKHEWTPANCTTAKTCAKCSETEGEPIGHVWEDATCTTPKRCSVCHKEEGAALGHTWEDATCTIAKHCSICRKAEGKALGHTWNDATCTTPKTCAVCNATEGKALGHTVEKWSVSVNSTCSETGIETGTCTVCNATVEQTLPLKEHTPGEWVVTVEPTETTEGTRIKTCKVCNAELEAEQFSLTPEEIKDRYKKSCKTISYKDLARTPDQYRGEHIKFSGNVVQVCSEGGSTLEYATYRVSTSGRYDNIMYIYLDKYDYQNLGKRILEDDRITFYGIFDGLITYETVLGASITIPSMKVEYID